QEFDTHVILRWFDVGQQCCAADRLDAPHMKLNYSLLDFPGMGQCGIAQTKTDGFALCHGRFLPTLDAVPEERRLAAGCNLITPATIRRALGIESAGVCHSQGGESCFPPASAALVPFTQLRRFAPVSRRSRWR